MAWWFNSQQRAAQRYARALPPWLIASYGASDFYTPGQIMAGIKAMKLDPRHAGLAFAAFSSEAEYRALALEQPEALPYEAARDSFFRWKSSGFGQDWNPLRTETPANE